MKLFLAVCFCSFSILSLAQNNSFSVSGKIKGLDSNEMRMVISSDKLPNGYRVEKIPVRNEAFSYTGNLDGYSLVTISALIDRVVKKVGNGYIPAKSSLLVFIGFPGAEVKFNGTITDFVDAYPSGDPANNDLARLNKQIFPLVNKSVDMEVKIGNKQIEGQQLISATKDSANRINMKVDSIKKQFIKDNPSSIAAAWLLSDMMMRGQISGDAAILAYNRMDKSLNDNPFFLKLKNEPKD